MHATMLLKRSVPRLLAAIGLSALFLLSAAATPASAALSSQQEALAKKLEGELIAPCCWTQTVAEHQSQAAEQMKLEIRDLISTGKGEKDILAAFVTQYGQRILAAPPRSGFGLLAYIIPFAALLVAVVAVTFFLLRSRRARSHGAASLRESEPHVSGLPTSGDTVSTKDRLRERLDDDLTHYDG